jgi:hypothetical protein
MYEWYYPRIWWHIYEKGNMDEKEATAFFYMC